MGISNVDLSVLIDLPTIAFYYNARWLHGEDMPYRDAYTQSNGLRRHIPVQKKACGTDDATI